VILGQSLTLSCDVIGTVKSISWWKNGAAMTMYNTTSPTNKSLTFDPVMHSDAGVYQCQAFNYVSNMTSDPYEFIVNCKYKSAFISVRVCLCVCGLCAMHVVYLYLSTHPSKLLQLVRRDMPG